MLEIFFCTYPELDMQLTEQTRRMVENSHIKAVTDGTTYRPMELIKLLRRPKNDNGLVIVLSGRNQTIDARLNMVLHVRAHFKDAYIIYVSESPYDDLLYLTNQHVRLSGYLTKPPYTEEYNHIISIIFNEYSREQLEADKLYTLIIGKQMQHFLLDDIIYFEARNKKVIMTTRSLTLDFYKSLTEIENELKGVFIRCHSGFLINIKYIRSISFKDMQITLLKDIKVPFSQKHKKEIEQIIKAFKQ